MIQLDKDTYESIYKILIDTDKMSNKLYKDNPRINAKFFVDAIFQDYFIGKTVNSIDLKYTQKSTTKIVIETKGQNMTWIKYRFKLIKSSKELTKTISSRFSEQDFKNFLIIYMTKTINKNELFHNSKILSEKVLNDWKEYLKILKIDKSIIDEDNWWKISKDKGNLVLINHYGNISIKEQKELLNIKNDQNIDNQTKKCLYKARIGQGKYREDLLTLHNNTCMISGIKAPELLIASHIIPWVESNHIEKLDKNNGLLLSASIDKLFDQYYISFDDNGFMIISEKFKQTHTNYKDIMSTIGIYKSFIEQRKSLSLSKETKEYMKSHFRELKK